MKKASFTNGPLKVGAIADDLTGAADMALALAGNGLPTTLYLNTPARAQQPLTPGLVIAQKIRTVPAAEAVRHALGAAEWLLAHRPEHLFYKYCSTFDSTPAGNIGPVTDALMQRTATDVTVVLPAFPDNGRTVRGGHLFVNEVPLSHSSMRHHPLTPMTDSYLPDLMDGQTGPGRTALIGQATVDLGSAAIEAALHAARADGKRYVVIDTGNNRDLDAIADAIAGLSLITGSAGVAAALPGALHRRGLHEPVAPDESVPVTPGHVAVLAGSCSEATRQQIAAFRTDAATISIDLLALAREETSIGHVASRARDAAKTGNVMLYTSAAPEVLHEVQAQLGVTASAALAEAALSQVARALYDCGIRKFIIAGGETAGAVAGALDIGALSVGPAIAPGVPWLWTAAESPLCLAFKSGNFGGADFFRRALEKLQ